MRMRRFTQMLTVVAIMLTIALATHADTPKTPAPANYVEKIVQTSDGNVTIDIPANILNILFPPAKTSTPTVHKGPEKTVNANVLRSGVNKLSGYRVQVFSQGNNQSSVETRARARGSAVVAKFPKYRGQVYSYSKAPNWYTRVGNFQTSQEASSALSELKRAFPQFAGEMRVVKCEITIVR